MKVPNIDVVDTRRVRMLLGDRESIGLKRDVVLALLDSYDQKKCKCESKQGK